MTGSGIAMHAAQEQVHAEIGDEHAKEGDEQEGVEGAGLVEQRQDLAVQGEGIHQQRDQRPGLFGIPGPVIAP